MEGGKASVLYFCHSSFVLSSLFFVVPTFAKAKVVGEKSKELPFFGLFIFFFDKLL